MKIIDPVRAVLFIAIGLAPALLLAADEPKPAALAPTAIEAKAEPKPETKSLAKVTPDVQAVLDRVSAAYTRLTSLVLAGTLKLEPVDSGQKQLHQELFTSSYQAPNKFRHEIKNQPLLGSSGTKIYGYSAQGNGYIQTDAAAGKPMLHDLPLDHARILALQNLSLVLALSKDPSVEVREMASEITKLPNQAVDGKQCTVLQLKLAEAKNAMIILFDAQTHFIRRVIVDMKPVFEQAGRPDIASAPLTVDYTTIKPDQQLKADQFAWAPPLGAKDLVAARAEALAAEADDEPATALAGKPAPDFTLPGLDGKKVALSNLKGSVVVLDFWATWCGPCVASLPHLNRIYQDNQKAGLRMFAVNQREGKEKVQDFVTDKNLAIPVLMDAEGNVARQYLVTGIPQTVIIGKDGMIKKVYVGFNPEGDDEFREVIAKELKAERKR